MQCSISQIESELPAVGANKIEDSADRLVLSSSQAPAELLQKERRTLGRAQHEHDVHCGYVDAFIEQIHREHRKNQIYLTLKSKGINIIVSPFFILSINAM